MRTLLLFFALLVFIPAQSQVIRCSPAYNKVQAVGGASTLLNGLVSYWQLDEISGTDAIDEMGVNDLAISGADINQSGKIGTSYGFVRASNDYIGSIDTDYEFANKFTISLWVKTSISGDDHPIISNWNAAYEDPDWVDYGFCIWKDATNDYAKFSLGNGTTSALHTLLSTSAINTGAWIHIVVTFDKPNAKIYINADNESSDTWNNDVTYDANCRFNIGGCVSVGGYYNGYIDEVAIYNRVLGQSGVDSLYNSGSGVTYPFE